MDRADNGGGEGGRGVQLLGPILQIMHTYMFLAFYKENVVGRGGRKEGVVYTLKRRKVKNIKRT
jgi:hypothetical protein